MASPVSSRDGRDAAGWWSQLERGAVLVGAAVAMAVALPTALVAEAVVDDGDSALGPPLFALVLVGFGLGGFVAGRRAPGAPLSNGAVAALAAYAVIQGAGAVRRAVVEDPVSVPAVVFAALLASSTGLLGAFLASRGNR